MYSHEKIGILGGSFNPVHHDHLAIAAKTKEIFSLTKVLFIPNASPAYKDSVTVSYKDRRAMLNMALEDFGDPDFEIADLEEDDSRHHYTCETLSILRKQYGPKTPLFFVMGSDSLLYIDEWKNGLSLHTLANLVCFTRTGYESKEIKPVIASLLQECSVTKDDHLAFKNASETPAGNIFLLNHPFHLLSSSALRKSIAKDGLNSSLAGQYMNARALSYACEYSLYK